MSLRSQSVWLTARSVWQIDENGLINGEKADRQHVCSTCGLVYACRSALKQCKYRHKEKVPTEPSLKTQCELCGKEVSEKHLAVHQVSHCTISMQEETRRVHGYDELKRVFIHCL